LTISPDHIVRRVRRLPIKGEVLVEIGQEVAPTDRVARALLPGPLQTIKVAEKLGIEAREMPSLISLQVGDAVEKGQVVAESKGFFGLFGKSTVLSDYTGTVEAISEVTGTVLVREPPIPVEITAYLRGRVIEVLPEEGCVVETRGAMIQGIFGVGGERFGTLRMAVESPNEVLDAARVSDDDDGKILVGGSCVTLDALRRATDVGVIGLVAGGVRDDDLKQFLGYDIGVAITGQEDITLSLMVTEGFGSLAMAERTFSLFRSLEGKEASMNGATQIRAGVIRPEVIVASAAPASGSPETASAMELRIGTPIRVIREPYFGLLGTVTELPTQLMIVESGSEVRVLRAKLQSGDEVLVPRANVEIIET
jgi:hypothetical protein